MSAIQPSLWNVAVIIVCVVLGAFLLYITLSSLSAVSSGVNISTVIG